MNVQEEIAEVAYELFETRSCVRGHELDDWLDAEWIVLGRHAGQDFEEPEEEGVSAAAAADVWKETRIPLKPSEEEAEEMYVNEEMS